ncbi:membrane protein FAM174B isoform X2 [Callorhinus ursinus]|uniref:membrane protein FAM174B isoform X2 n=1 Tax=Callorhinus ursinus TaxID=34884 RepID=UPI003CD0158A
MEAVGGTKLLRTRRRPDPELRWRRGLEGEGTALRHKGSQERSGKRLKKTRKYDIITTPAERVEMAPLNEDDDDDEDSTVFDIKYRCGPALPLPSTGDSWARAVTQWDRPPGTWAPSKPWNWNPVCGGKAQCFRLSHQYRGHLPGAFCWAWQTRPAAKSDLLNPRASARGLLNKTLSA